MSLPSSDGVDYADTNDDLQRVMEKVTEAKSRVKLLDDMIKQDLCTRDIFSFALKQAKAPKDEIQKRVTEAAEILQIENLLRTLCI